jgi:hypothetical protein
VAVALMIPEIEAIDDVSRLKAFLSTRPSQESSILAQRFALAIMPIITLATRSRGERLSTQQIKSLTLRVFQNNAILWGVDLYSGAPTSKALFAASRFVSIDHVNSSYASKAANAAKEAAEAGSFVALSEGLPVVDEKTLSLVTVDPVPVVLDSVASAADAAATVFAMANCPEYFWQNVRADIELLIGHGAEGLYKRPLFHSPPPERMQYYGNQFLLSLERWSENWGLIANWYFHVRDGGETAFLSSSELNAIEQASFQDEAFWCRDPDLVIAEIAALMSAARKGNRKSQENSISTYSDKLVQTPAAFRFSTDAHSPIDAIPMPAETALKDFAVTMLAETREKACSLLARLEGANAAARVVSSARRLSEVLPERLDALNPALLRSRTRSLEADAIAFSSAGAEAELFVDAVAAMLDLTATAKDLQSCFSEIAAVEREAAKIEIAGREEAAEAVVAEIHISAIELSSRCPQLVTENAAAAVGALKADIADAPSIEVKADLLASASLVSGNFLTAAYRKVLSATGRETLRIAGRHYQAAVNGSVVGTEELFKKAPLLLLACYLGGPLLAGAAIFANFKTLKEAKDMVDQIEVARFV